MGDDSYDYDSGFHLFSGVQHCKEFGTYLFPRLLVVTKCAGLRGSGLHDHDRVEFLQENLGNSDNGTSTLYPETRDFANPDVQARQLPYAFLTYLCIRKIISIFLLPSMFCDPR